MVKKETVTLPVLYAPKELVVDADEVRKLKGLPWAVFRRRALAHYVIHLREEFKLQVKRYALED